MPVPKRPAKNKKSFPESLLSPKKLQKAPWLSIHSLLVILGAVVFALAWTLIVEQLQPKAPSLKAEAVSKAAADQYNNLDLSQARTAVYTNSAIHIVKELGPVDGVKRSVVSFDVPKDNLFEYAYMTTPNTPAKNGKYPVVILCHGYADPTAYSTSNTYLADMEFYSQHGFVVIKPDLRGQGLSLTKGSPDGAYFSMGYNTDVMSLIAAVKQTSYLNSKAINLWGHSMGAYIALRAAVLSNDIKSVILLSTPGDVVEQAEQSLTPISDRENPEAFRVRTEEIAQHGLPLTDRAFWDKTSPLNYLADTKAYFQIHVGSDDKVVSSSPSAALDAKLTSLHEQHGYYVYYGGQHGLVPQRALIWQRSLQVLAQS